MGEAAKTIDLEDEFDGDDEDAQSGKFLTFRIGNEDYGIEIRHVTEIIGLQRITEVPDMGSFSIISDPDGAVFGLWEPKSK